MKKVFFFGLPAALLAIGLVLAGCDDGGNGNNNNGGNTSGSGFTITGIPSEYNGKYAISESYSEEGYSESYNDPIGEDDNFDDYGVKVLGFQSYNSPGIYTLPRISNGSVTIPLWTEHDYEYAKYSGNDTLGITVGIIDGQEFDLDSNAEDEGEIFIAVRDFPSVSFTNGNASRAWSQGTEFELINGDTVYEGEY